MQLCLQTNILILTIINFDEIKQIHIKLCEGMKTFLMCKQVNLSFVISIFVNQRLD